MYGSCCEEQEAKEAAARSRIRAATELSESRLMHGHRVRQQMFRSLRCTHGPGCMVCEPDGPRPTAQIGPPVGVEDGSDSEPSILGSDEDDFGDDDEFMAKLRATRLGQMKGAAEAQARQQACLASHGRLRPELLAALLSDARDAGAAPLLLHLYSEDSEAGPWVESILAREAANFTTARLVTVVCGTAAPPPCAAFARPLPALVLVERGLPSARCDGLDAFREPEQLAAHVCDWLETQRMLLQARALAGDASEGEGEEDEEAMGFCGRPGCRRYPHEHVQAGQHEVMGGSDLVSAFDFTRG
jgi:hypothetical protein